MGDSWLHSAPQKSSNWPFRQNSTSPLERESTRFFLGFEVVEVIKDELRAWSPSEHCAAVIDIQHSGKVARIAQTVFKRPIRRVSVILRGMRHDICEQPVWGPGRTVYAVRPAADEDYS
jgi:hypothetical protein